MTPLRRSQSWTGALLALALIAPPAAAQSVSTRSSSSTPLSEALHGPARDAYESGKLLATNRDYTGALTKFQQAYSLSSEPRLLYDMAICEKELRHYARMQALLQKYAHEGGSRISSDNRALVDQALAAIVPLVATITLAVSEPGAVVSIDGEPVGTTPLTTPLAVDLGKHTLVVKKAGFQSVEQTIDTPGGGSSSLAISLEPQRRFGRLAVRADDDATVLVDDKVAGKGHFEGSLLPGSHEVRVTESGKSPYVQEIQLRDGETRTMQVTLESSEHHSAPWLWIVGGAAVAAGGVVGGYFLFRPSDQTAPAPTGKLGTGSVTFLSGRYR
jgi:PEGA domain-containing protein